MRRQDGQAAVELVALVPLLVAAAFATFAVLAAGRASATAESAAEAGAIALIQGGDPTRAARLVAGPTAVVRIRGGHVRVAVRPALPLLAEALTAVAEADAGPRRPAPLTALDVRGGDGLGSRPASAPPASPGALSEDRGGDRLGSRP